MSGIARKFRTAGPARKPPTVAPADVARGQRRCCWRATFAVPGDARSLSRCRRLVGTPLEMARSHTRSAGWAGGKDQEMTKKQWLIGIVLADFAVLNVWAAMQYGYVGVFREVLSTLPGILVSVDLTIALTLVAIWMWNDAKRRGIAVVPYLVVGLFLGSVGPLLYLLRRPDPDGADSPVRLAAHAG
jgi:hypothetical protein